MMRLFALLFALIGLIGGGVAAWFYADYTITRLETRNLSRVASALHAAELGWPRITADGQIIVVSGSAPDAVSAQLVLDMTSDILPMAVLIDRTTIDAAGHAAAGRAVRALPPRLEILRSAAGISMMGRAPNSPALGVLRSTVAAMPNGAAAMSLIEETNDLPTPEWDEALTFATRALSQAPEVTVTVQPGAVTIEAVANTAGWQEGLSELLENMRPADVVLNLNIQAPRAVISPFRFVLDQTVTPPAVDCAARNESEAAVIIAAVTAAGVDPAMATCELGLGAPSEQWGALVAQSVATLHELGGGRLDIVNTDVTFSHLNAEFEALAKAEAGLRANLPSVYSLRPLSASLVETVSSVDPATSPNWGLRFIGQLDNDGQLTLRGMVHDELTQKVIFTYAEARFGVAQVSSELIVATGLPEGWQARIFTAIDVLDMLDQGQVTLSPTLLQLRGSGAQPDLLAALSVKLDAAVGAGNYRLQVTQLDPLPIQDAMLDPRVCAGRIAAILQANQINFAPSSAVIEESSAPVIVEIAALLHECRSTAFEIGGHTDSQGREEMNLALSQSRADSVLDSILGQNLLMGNLTAVGYGESAPIADNGTEEGRAANRRIEIIPTLPVQTAPPEESANEQN